MPQDPQSALASGPVVNDAGVGGYMIGRETVQFVQLVTSEIVKGRFRLLHPKAYAEFFVADLSEMGRQVSDRSKAFVEPLSESGGLLGV